MRRNNISVEIARRFALPSRFFVVFLFLCAALPGALVFGQAVPASAVLSDQFGKETRLGELAASGKVIILYSGERDAGDYLLAWRNALKAALASGAAGPSAAGEPKILAAANLSAVPFFVPKGAIVKQLAEEYPDLPILLDWKGVLAKPLALGKDAVLAVAFRDGNLLESSRSKASPAEAARLASRFP